MGVGRASNHAEFFPLPLAPSRLGSQLPTFFHLWAVRKGGRLYVFSFQRPTDWGIMVYIEPSRPQDSLQPLEIKGDAEMWVTVTSQGEGDKNFCPGA